MKHSEYWYADSRPDGSPPPEDPPRPRYATRQPGRSEYEWKFHNTKGHAMASNTSASQPISQSWKKKTSGGSKNEVWWLNDEDKWEQVL